MNAVENALVTSTVVAVLRKYHPISVKQEEEAQAAVDAIGLFLKSQKTGKDKQQVRPGQVWEHKNRTTVTVLGVANVRSADPDIVVYADENNSLMTLPLAEWHTHRTLIGNAVRPNNEGVTTVSVKVLTDGSIIKE